MKRAGGRVLGVFLGLAGAVAPAAADTLRDPALQALADAHRLGELEQAALARVAAHPDDGSAWLAYAESTLAQTGTDAPARRAAALTRLEACVHQTPKLAACHYGVGALAGVQILSQGMLKAALGIGRVRDEFTQALALDAGYAPARSGLVQWYLMVPGLAGGSVSKAREIAQAEVQRAPAYGKVLTAMILAFDNKPADAERQLAGLQSGGDLELADELREQWLTVGFAYLQDKQVANARSVFERLVQDRPDQPDGHYGLGRALTEQQQWDAAIAELQRAAALPGHEAYPIDYRLGVACQGKGDNTQARAAFVRYLSAPGANRPNIDDAKRRLADLG